MEEPAHVLDDGSMDPRRSRHVVNVARVVIAPEFSRAFALQILLFRHAPFRIRQHTPMLDLPALPSAFCDLLLHMRFHTRSLNLILLAASSTFAAKPGLHPESI